MLQSELPCLPNEIWLEAKGYEDKILVSNFGRVWSLSLDRILKQNKNCPNGYFRISIWVNRKERKILVHRLVAETFLENPYNLKYVNHKDENKENNNVENLEWCTHQYNMTYKDKHKKCGEKLKGWLNHIPFTCGVLQIDKDTEEVLCVYSSIDFASKINGVSASAISGACRGRLITLGGYKWKYLRKGKNNADSKISEI